jgi:hypothetical protein
VSPTQRSLDLLRKEGWLCQVVEVWNPHSRTRKDLFGFIDVLAVRGEETLAVQATSRSNISARVSKIANHENIAAVRAVGWGIQVWGWGKMANGRWEVRRVDVS